MQIMRRRNDRHLSDCDTLEYSLDVGGVVRRVDRRSLLSRSHLITKTTKDNDVPGMLRWVMYF